MYDRVTVTEDCDRGLVLAVPGAPADPYSAVSLYLLDDAHGAGRAAHLQARLVTADLEADVEHRHGVLSVTASCPPEQVPALLAVIGAAINDSTSTPNLDDSDPAVGTQAQVRSALFREPSRTTSARPGPLVVAVAPGSTEALAAAVRLLDTWPGRGLNRTATRTTPRNQPLELAGPAPSKHTHLRLGCLAPARDDARYRAVALAAVQLAAVDGPVSMKLRQQSSAAYSVAARVHPELGCGWLTVSTVLRREARPDAAQVVVQELRRLADDPPDEDRMAALRSRMTLRIARALSDNRGRCSDAISGVLYGLPLDHQMGINSGVAAVTRADVAAAARALDLTRLVEQEVALP